MDFFEEILTVLSSGKKTSFEIATELGFAPARITAQLATLTSLQKVKKVGKTRSNGKDVAIYAAINLDAKEECVLAQSKQENSTFDITSRLHQVWGGYLSVSIKPSKKCSILKHKIE